MLHPQISYKERVKAVKEDCGVVFEVDMQVGTYDVMMIERD